MGYFKPLRRKIGMATLVLACVLMAGWVRSLLVTESIMYRSGENTLHTFQSSRIGLIWTTVHEGESKIVASNKYQRLEGQFSSPLESHALWSRKILGFEFGELEPSVTGMTIGVWVIRYWTIVIPLTLLSAWLLLSKPRAKASEPT